MIRQLVPVTLSKSRLHQRQLNQAQLLALKIQRHISTLNLPKTNPIIQKTQGSNQANTLDIEQRRKNVQNILRFNLLNCDCDHIAEIMDNFYEF